MSQPDSTNQAIDLPEAYLSLPSCEATGPPFSRELNPVITGSSSVQLQRPGHNSYVPPDTLAVPKKTGQDMTLGGSTFPHWYKQMSVSVSRTKGLIK